MKFPYRVEWYKALIYTAVILSASSTAGRSQDIQTYIPTRESTKLLHSLPTNVQKDIEKTRAICRSINPGDPSRITAGDEGLNSFTVDGKQAVMIDDMALCKGCSPGYACSNRGTRSVKIYVLQGKTWTKALSEDAFTGEIFISHKPKSQTGSFGYGELNALVGDLFVGNKDCPTIDAGSTSAQSYEARTCVIRWNRGKFVYKPL